MLIAYFQRIDQFVLDCLVAAKKSKGSYDETEELDPLVVGDEMRCRQIFTNLTRYEQL